MAEFETPVCEIVSVVDHPNADRLSIVTVRGYECISAKLEDGSHRYKPGDLVVYVKEDSLVPESLLRQFGFWDDAKGKGSLSGRDGNRVRTIKLRNVYSTGLLFPVDKLESLGSVSVDDDVSEKLGIVKYEPPIPTAFSGNATRAYGGKKFDVNNALDRLAFLQAEKPWVVVTSKIHGTSFGVFAPASTDNPNLLIDDIPLFCSTKNMGNQGIVFENTPENIEGNLYVRVLHREKEAFKRLVRELREREYATDTSDIIIRSEIYGPGIQGGYDYGKTRPEYAVFGIWVDNVPIAQEQVLRLCDELNVNRVPCFCQGPFDLDAIKRFRDGPEPIAGKHIHEGVVITSSQKDNHGNDILLKLVNPEYLIAQGKNKNATEFT